MLKLEERSAKRGQGAVQVTELLILHSPSLFLFLFSAFKFQPVIFRLLNRQDARKNATGGLWHSLMSQIGLAATDEYLPGSRLEFALSLSIHQQELLRRKREVHCIASSGSQIDPLES